MSRSKWWHLCSEKQETPCGSQALCRWHVRCVNKVDQRQKKPPPEFGWAWRRCMKEPIGKPRRFHSWRLIVTTWTHIHTTSKGAWGKGLTVLETLMSYGKAITHTQGVGGAVRFLVVGTIGQGERPPRGQLWMEQCLTSLKYWPI